MKYGLSKSLYCNGLQCPKMLWLMKYRPELFDKSVMNQAVLDAGTRVGAVARGLFGDYTEVPYNREDLSSMLHETDRLMAAGIPVIAEASFSYESCFCSVDILKNLGGGRVELYEVKNNSKVKDRHLDDIAYQYYVLTKLGFTVERACLVLRDNEYVRRGELELQKLFTIVDETELVRSRLPEIESSVRALRTVLESPTEPACEIGMHCFSPYDCGFWQHCTRDLPHPNVFNLSIIRKSTKFKSYRNGIISLEDVLRTKTITNRRARMQAEHEVHDLPDHIEREPIAAFLNTLSYPLYFLDFEAMRTDVPLFDGTHPAEVISFQYSLHIVEREGAPLQHKEYLAYPGSDPRRALAEQLCRDIPMNVCTVAYYSYYERDRLTALAALYPDLKEHLLSIAENLVDLEPLFSNRYYYNRAMQGRSSLKSVLPALFPDDPELNYSSLEDVHNGTDAPAVFARMDSMPPDELEKARADLLAYCRLDTFAMVKLLEKLREAAGLEGKFWQ